MPTPIEFKSITELVAAATSAANQAAFNDFFRQRFTTPKEAVDESVQGNTFRAFRFNAVGIHDLKPSAVYRTWTTDWLTQSLSGISAINSRTELRRFVIKGAHALDNHWSEVTGSRNLIGFGRAAKLLNLSVKHIVCLAAVKEADRDRLIAYLDVPLDSYTLVGVRLLLPELAIPSNATMKFVRDEAHYVHIQDAITRLCAPECLPVQYEIASWNLPHGNRAKRI